MTDKWIVRLYDHFDGWMDITGPVDIITAQRIWDEKTGFGQMYSSYQDGDYYKIFPANTKMLYSAE
jgi:hypothetical protein